VLVLPRFFGLDGIVISQPVADVMFFMLALPLSLGMLRELRSLQDDPVPVDTEAEMAVALE